MSKLLMFDFLCRACGFLAEELVKPDEHHVVCPGCGGKADRQVSAARINWVESFAMGSNATPATIDRWDKMRRKKMAIENKKLQDHGTYE